MKKSRPVIRPATAEDIEAFAPDVPKPTIRAWVGELDGEIIGIGGLAFSQGRWLAFYDMKEEARKYKLTLVKAAKAFMEEARKDGIKFVYAKADETEPGAIRWMESLGFEIDPKSLSLYRWKGN